MTTLVVPEQGASFHFRRLSPCSLHFIHAVRCADCAQQNDGRMINASRIKQLVASFPSASFCIFFAILPTDTEAARFHLVDNASDFTVEPLPCSRGEPMDLRFRAWRCRSCAVVLLHGLVCTRMCFGRFVLRPARMAPRPFAHFVSGRRSTWLIHPDPVSCNQGAHRMRS